MNRIGLLILLLLCCSSTAFAAEGLSGDVFGGFSLDHRSNDNSTLTYTGWQANAAFDVHKAISAVADFAGEYKKFEDGQVHYLFGPRFSWRTGKVTYFGEALYGGNRIKGNNFFAMGYGGGVDIKAGKVMIRVIQFDWVPTNVGGEIGWVTNNTRFGFGVAIPFGMRK
jgi:hypothetical protein